MKLLDNNELMHHGVKGQKWGVIRYKKKQDSIKRRQKRDAESIEKSRKVGTERLNNRIKKLDKEIDRKAVSAFSQRDAANLEKRAKYIKKVANDIKNDDKRLVNFGNKTRTLRGITSITSATFGSGAAIGVGAAFIASNPGTLLASVAAGSVAAGSAYVHSKLYD